MSRKIDPPLTIDEIASITKQGRPSIYRAIDLGHLKTYLVGRRRFARESAVQAWIDKMEKQSDAGAPIIYRPRVGA